MIELGQIQMDTAVLERQLRHDLKDDWFPDTVRFKDYFGTGRIEQLANTNFEQNHGVYIPQKRVVENVPKPDFTLRAALETGIVDRAIYHGVCANLCDWLDPLIPWYVFSHRSAIGTQKSKYMFRRGIPSWRDFHGSVRTSLSTGKFLLTTDLTTYFDNINIDKLKHEMSLLVAELNQTAAVKNTVRAHIDFLFNCLKHWTYEGHRGLPQNRDASSFLANVYMRRVDLNMRNAGYTYFRYMDDIRIICDSDVEARKALKQLVIEIRQLGLSVNSKKTSIVHVINQNSLDECIEEPSQELRYLQALWDTRKISSIKASFAPLRKLALKELRENNLMSREFRFAMNRLVLLAGCKEVSVPETFFSEITHLIIDALPKQPSPTDKYVEYLERVPLDEDQIAKIVSFLINSDLNIYEWQSYRLWNLIGVRKISSETLISCALQQLDRNDGPARAGATLFLGANGNQDQKQQIAIKFPKIETFIGQRAALIAMQELPFRPFVEKYVAGNVRKDLHNIYRNAKKSNLGYFSDPEPVSLTQFVDPERDHVS